MTEIQLVDQAAILLREAREQRARADRLEASLAEVRRERDEEKANAIAAEAALAYSVDERVQLRLEIERLSAIEREARAILKICSASPDGPGYLVVPGLREAIVRLSEVSK